MWLMSRAEEAFKNQFGSMFKVDKYGMKYEIEISPLDLKVTELETEKKRKRIVWQTDGTYENLKALLMIYGFGEIEK